MFIRIGKKEMRLIKNKLCRAKEEQARLARNKRKRFVFAVYSDNILPSYVFFYGPAYRYLSVKRYLIKKNIGEIKLKSLWAESYQARNSCEAIMEKAKHICNEILNLELDFRVMSLDKWIDDMMGSEG